jgi:exodeoxyribonuclease VII large subunit
MHTLLDLNVYIRQVLALNFQQPLWITAEIAQIGQSKGHFYLDLVQNGPDKQPVAQAQAAIWATEYRRLFKKLGIEIHALLQEGVQIKCLVLVDFHERYGLKLHIQDIDPAFTLGQMHLHRRLVLEQLKHAGLTTLNRSLPLAPVLQRIAVISSDGAAGWQDFREHLAQNPYGYHFQLELFQSAVQGKNAEQEVIQAAEKISERMADFDAVAIVRGGGSRLDLGAFDQFHLCAAVARLPLPVFSGIGHDVDETALDRVAYHSLKTPTAVADFLIQHNFVFENAVFQQASEITFWAANLVKNQHQQLVYLEKNLFWAAQTQMQQAFQELRLLETQLPQWTDRLLRQQHRNLEQWAQWCYNLHPQRLLEKGYAIVRKNGQLIRSEAALETGDRLDITLRDGDVRAQVSD